MHDGIRYNPYRLFCLTALNLPSAKLADGPNPIQRELTLMTIGELWREYNTVISIVVGLFVTVGLLLIPRMRILWKGLIAVAIVFLLTGLLGLLKYLGFLAVILSVFYGGSFVIWVLGIAGIAWLAVIHGWHLSWWQIFLIGGVWAPLSMILDIGVIFVIGLIVNRFSISSNRLPRRARQE